MISSDSIQAVTFDFYDTLAFHRAGHGRGRALTGYMREVGYEPGPWEHRILYRVFANHLELCPPASNPTALAHYRTQLASRALEELGIEVSETEAADHAEALWRILGPESLDLFPEVQATLADLDRVGVRMAVISNWQSGLLHFLDELGVLEHFGAVVCSDDVGSEKPDPGIFERAARELGVDPSTILHVGDSYVDDFEGSLGAGFQAVLLARDGMERPPGVRNIENLREVRTLLRAPGST